MKLNKSSQLLLVSAASLVAAGLVTACGTLTTDFVYVTSATAAGPNSYGEIDVYEINSVSGAMRQIPTSPFPSDGRNPVAEAVASDHLSLYVVNQDDNTIVQFLIGPDGKLYPQSTVNTPGVFPMAVAVHGSNLFVLDTYQPLPSCSNAQPCSGSVAVYPVLPSSGKGSTATPSGELGPPVTNGSLNYWPLGLSGSGSADVIVPTGVNVVASGAYLYVSAYDSTAGGGYVFGFSVGSNGVLSALPGSPFAAGTHPSAIASDPSSSFVYVADFNTGGLLAYSISSGVLAPLPSVQYNANPYPGGNQPSAIVVDPIFPYLYVTNAQDGNVRAYAISSGALLCNQAYHYIQISGTTPVAPPPFATIPAGALCNLGSLSNASSSGTFSTGDQPVAIGIDPSTSHFVFTANNLGGNVSDFELDSASGALVNTQRSPYKSNTLPTAVAAVPHGAPPK